VVTLIPANGAADVPQATAITVYASGFPLSASTLNGNSFQVSANGQLVSGTLTLVGTNAIQFTPTSALPYSALVQIYVTNSLTDTYGNPLQANNSPSRATHLPSHRNWFVMSRQMQQPTSR
jgi:hypothetical protein